MDTRPETKELAEQILSEIFQSLVQLGDGVKLADRDHVLRYPVLSGPQTAPTSVVVKNGRARGGAYDPDTSDQWNPAWVLLNEWASLELLQTVAGDLKLAPQLYGGSRPDGLIILEDLGAGVQPDHLLLGQDAEQAEAILIELATRLGSMHARTIGHYDEFVRLCERVGRKPSSEPDPSTTLATALHATLDVLGITPPPGLDAELADLMATFQQPDPFFAYSHGDPCPDNWLRSDGMLHLLDFEYGRYRHALLDGVYGRIHFPTCWCVNRLPQSIAQAMEVAYRTALVEGCPAASDDRLFGQAVTAACAHWVIDLCHWVVERPAWYAPPHVLQRDRQWGISTIQQRALVRFELLAETTTEFRYLEAIGAAAEQIAKKLRAHWPPAADAMPYYPAFRSTVEGPGEARPSQ